MTKKEKRAGLTGMPSSPWPPGMHGLSRGQSRIEAEDRSCVLYVRNVVGSVGEETVTFTTKHGQKIWDVWMDGDELCMTAEISQRKVYRWKKGALASQGLYEQFSALNQAEVNMPENSTESIETVRWMGTHLWGVLSEVQNLVRSMGMGPEDAKDIDLEALWTGPGSGVGDG